MLFLNKNVSIKPNRNVTLQCAGALTKMILYILCDVLLKNCPIIK